MRFHFKLSIRREEDRTGRFSDWLTNPPSFIEPQSDTAHFVHVDTLDIQPDRSADVLPVAWTVADQLSKLQSWKYAPETVINYTVYANVHGPESTALVHFLTFTGHHEGKPFVWQFPCILYLEPSSDTDHSIHIHLYANTTTYPSAVQHYLLTIMKNFGVTADEDTGEWVSEYGDFSIDIKADTAEEAAIYQLDKIEVINQQRIKHNGKPVIN